MPALHADRPVRASKSSTRRMLAAAVERLEPRQMLCIAEHPHPIAEGVVDGHLPQYTGSGPEADTGGIVWSNRGTTDNFTTVFGTQAANARQVVDAAFFFWNQVITNLNQSGGNDQLDITVTVGDRGTGQAGTGGVNTLLGDKPRTGSINIGGGSDFNLNGTVADGEGYYIDLTPYDFSEFQGDIINSATGTATSGTAADNDGYDLFSLIAIEIQHALGFEDRYSNLRWRTDPNDYIRPTGTSHATSQNDTADTPGKLYYLNAPGVQALLTSNNGGPGGEDRGYPVHTARPGQSYTTGGVTYTGQTDTGATGYFNRRRHLPSVTSVRALGAVYGYSVNAPQDVSQTFYAVPDRANRRVLVRNTDFGSSDVMQIRSISTTFFIDIDIGRDVAGTNTDGLTTYQFSKTAFDTIIADGGGATDYMRLESNEGSAVTLNGGAGDDFIDFSFGSRNLNFITGNAHVQGGAGSDQIFVYDNNQAGAQAHTITSGRFDRAGWGGFSYASDIEFLNLTTGSAADTVNVQSTFANQPVWLWNAAGTDTVNIGNTSNGIRSINANVTVENNPSFTTLNINNGPDTGARTWNVDGVGNFGYIVGMAPANIYWDNADIQAINLMCGSGVDTGQFVISSETFNVNNAGSNDFIRVGVPAAQGLQLITGQLTIDNTPARTALTIDDSGSNIARTITVDEAGGYNTVSGMTPLPIRFDDFDTSSTTLITGGGSDTVNVPRNDDTLIISNSGSPDTVNLGNSTNGLQSITGNVRVKNPPNVTSLFINDGPNSVTRTPTLDTVFIELDGYGSWSGLAPGLIEYKYAEMSFINVTLGSGADVINIRKSQGNLNMNTTGGGDAYTIGGASNGAQSVGGEITFQNPSNHNSITVNDAANTVGRNATLNDEPFAGFIFGWLTGLAPASLLYKYNDTNAVNIIHGSGNDNLTVRRHQDALTIQGTAGSDTVTLGGFAGIGMNGVIAPTTVSNASGTTTLVLDDSTDAAVNVLTHEMANVFTGRVTGMSPAAVDYRVNQVNRVRLRTGTQADAVTMFETHIDSRVYFDPASSTTGVFVNGDGHGSAALYTDRSVTMALLQIGNGGAVNQTPGNFTLRTNGLTVDSTGKLDISDGAAILNYTGTTPMPAIQADIIQGYNGGNWLGNGITSSTAAAGSSTAVGYAEATDLFSTFPATWLGQSIDNTTILMRHTLYGDATLDHIVNLADYNRVSSNYGQSPRRWSQGDFNFNNLVNLADYNILAARYGTSLGPEAAITSNPRFGRVPILPSQTSEESLFELM